jgi:hypothetical protein
MIRRACPLALIAAIPAAISVALFAPRLWPFFLVAVLVATVGTCAAVLYLGLRRPRQGKVVHGVPGKPDDWVPLSPRQRLAIEEMEQKYGTSAQEPAYGPGGDNR